MSNYEEFRDILKQYFADKGIEFPIETTLHDSSKNDHDKNTVPTYLYAGEKNSFGYIDGCCSTNRL